MAFASCSALNCHDAPLPRGKSPICGGFLSPNRHQTFQKWTLRPLVLSTCASKTTLGSACLFALRTDICTQENLIFFSCQMFLFHKLWFYSFTYIITHSHINLTNIYQLPELGSGCWRPPSSKQKRRDPCPHEAYINLGIWSTSCYLVLALIL